MYSSSGAANNVLLILLGLHFEEQLGKGKQQYNNTYSSNISLLELVHLSSVIIQGNFLQQNHVKSRYHA